MSITNTFNTHTVILPENLETFETPVYMFTSHTAHMMFLKTSCTFMYHTIYVPIVPI